MSKARNNVQYILILLLVYASGSIFFVSFNYSTFIPLLTIITALYWIFIPHRNRRFCLKKHAVEVMLATILFMGCVIVFNGVRNVSSYIAILFQILIAFFVSEQIERNDFIEKYVNVITFFAGVSLVFFSLMLVYPSIMLIFPKTIGQGSVDYYNAIIHVYESAKGFSFFYQFRRNASIFWEPGAFQAFLNVALLLLLEKRSFGNNKGDIWKILIIVLAVITTYSITGYLVLFCIFAIENKKIRAILGKNTVYGFLAIVFGLTVVISVNANSLGNMFISDKFQSSFGSDRRFLNRLFLDDFFLIFNYPLGFLGISYERYESLSSGSGNSIVQTIVTLGIPFTFMLLYMYLRFALKFRKWLLFFALFIIVFSTESLLWRPLFLCFGWYGFHDLKKENI